MCLCSLKGEKAIGIHWGHAVFQRPLGLYPEVNKIQRLGRILDDKVEVFDDLQRRMEELNANARMLSQKHRCHKREADALPPLFRAYWYMI